MEQWYPTPQLTVYLDKVLRDDADMKVIIVLKQEDYTVRHLRRFTPD